MSGRARAGPVPPDRIRRCPVWQPRPAPIVECEQILRRVLADSVDCSADGAVGFGGGGLLLVLIRLHPVDWSLNSSQTIRLDSHRRTSYLAVRSSRQSVG